MALISQSDWARQQGFSRQYVSELVKKGVIQLVNKQIDTEQANLALEAIRNPNKESKREGNTSVSGDLPRMLLQARIKNEVEKGKLLEAKAKAEAGKLIDADEVKKAAFNTARVVRDNLLNIPDRVSALLTSIDNEQEIYQILTEEIRLALEGLENE